MATVTSLTRDKIVELMAGWEGVALSQDGINADLSDLKVSLQANDASLAELNNMTLPQLRADLDAGSIRVSELNDTTLPNLQNILDQHELNLTNLNTVDIPSLQTQLSSNSDRLIELDEVTLPALQLTLDANTTSINDLEVTTIPNLNTELTAAKQSITTIETVTIPGVQSIAESAKSAADAAKASAIDLIVNGGFEDGLNEWTGNATLEEASAFRGSKSVMLLPNGFDALEQMGPSNVIEGETWRWECVYRTSDTFTGSIGVRPLRYPTSLYGANIPSYENFSQSVEWTVLSFDYTVESGITEVNPWRVAGNIDTGWIQIDEIRCINVTDVKVLEAVASDAQNSADLAYERWAPTGAVTISGGMITADSITSLQVAADAITANKIAANAVTAGSIATNAITSAKIAAGAIVSDKIAANAVTANEIATRTITAAEIAVGGITAEEIAAGTITATQIAAGAITATKIATGAVTATEIATGAITAIKVAADAITSNSIATGAVIADSIAADAVTATKVAANAITANSIAANAITATKIAANAVTAESIAADAVTANEIKAGEITSAHVVTAGLDAAVIKFGTMSGSRIQTGSITIGQVNDLQSTLNSKETPSGAQAKATAAELSAIAEAVSKSYLNSNPTFSNWTSTVPAGFTTWNKTPTKETTLARIKPHAARWNMTAAEDAGMRGTTSMDDVPFTEYVTVEMDVMLKSGTFSGSGLLIDFLGVTSPSRAYLALNAIVPNPELNKWYRITQVVKRPSPGGTQTSWQVYVMANYSGLHAKSAKDIIVNQLGFRSSTAEEITAYNAPSDAQAKATAAKADAITDATNKYDTARARVSDWTATGTTEIDGGSIKADSITAAQIKADAIDGMTITGVDILGGSVSVGTSDHIQISITDSGTGDGTIEFNVPSLGDPSRIYADDYGFMYMTSASDLASGVRDASITLMPGYQEDSAIEASSSKFTHTGRVFEAIETFSAYIKASNITLEASSTLDVWAPLFADSIRSYGTLRVDGFTNIDGGVDVAGNMHTHGTLSTHGLNNFGPSGKTFTSMRFGSAPTDTNANGLSTVAHGFNSAPNFIVVTPGAGGTARVGAVANVGSINFQVEWRRLDNGALLTNNSNGTFDWIAYTN